jgi:tRNA nucleotidyltransferase/poly(A) polymerase
MAALRDLGRVASFLLHQSVVRALSAAAAAEGVTAAVVGGLLRDRLLGLSGADWDATLSGRGGAVADRLVDLLGARRVDLGGKEFGAYRLVGQDFVLDLWDREGGSLEADLRRRDLTVNAFALTLPDGRWLDPAGGRWLDPAGGRWLDPAGGLGDLAARRLRAVGADSFVSDPLRVLRLPRFWVQLPGFSVVPETLALAHAAVPGLASVAAERVRDELDKIFRHPEAHRGLALLAHLDLYPGLWRGRPGSSGATGQAVSQLARLAPRALELRRLAPAAVAANLAVDHRRARWALSFAELGADAEQHLAAFGRAGFLAKADGAAVADLLAERAMPRGEISERRFLHRLGPAWGTAVTVLGARAEDLDEWRARARALTERFAQLGAEIFDPPRLVDGREAGEILGRPPGPQLGRALAALREAQVDGRVSTRDDAVRLLERLAGERPA